MIKDKLEAAVRLVNELSNKGRKLEPEGGHPAWYEINKACRALEKALDLLNEELKEFKP